MPSCLRGRLKINTGLYNNTVRTLFCNLVLLCFSGLIGIGLIEGLLRIPWIDRHLYPRQIGWNTEAFQQLHRFDDQLHKWMLRGVTEMRHQHDFREYDYRITTIPCDGVFVRSQCYDHPVGFHFGDSFTFGFGVAQNQMFVALLDASRPGQVNFATAGDNILSMLDQAIQLLERLPATEQPQFLFLHIFLGNDIEEALEYLERLAPPVPQENPHKIEAERAVQPSQPFSLKHALIHWKNQLAGQSRIRKLLYDRLTKTEDELFSEQAPAGDLFLKHHLQYYDALKSGKEPEFGELRRVIAEYKTRMRRLAQVFHGQIVVTLIPPKEVYAINADRQVFNAMKALFCQDIPGEPRCIDLLDAIGDHEFDRFLSYFYKIDTHFNAAGHAVFAELIAHTVF